MARVSLTIDGKTVSADEGQTLLAVCREQQIAIPTLCQHDALTSDGRCRLCVVELKEGSWSKLVTSCLYPAKAGLTIETASARVKKTRAMILELLLARCPESPELQQLAREHGVEKPRFTPDTDKGNCILCGMCIRTCADVIGVSAIGTAQRGKDKLVAPPFGEPAADCIGCGACAYVCPTGAIHLTDRGLKRRIAEWKVEFELVPCRECGKPTTTRPHLSYLKRRLALPDYIYDLCDECKRQFHLEQTLAIGHP